MMWVTVDENQRAYASTDEAAVNTADYVTLSTWVDVTGVFDAQAPFEAIDPEDPSQTWEGLGTLRLYVGSFFMESSGSLRQLRIWTGAMNENDIRDQVLDPTVDDATTLSQ
ncbi:hypothetical protein [Streptomyces niveus]|uniref:hypothetical protein n=1 Tax=Streptomyces niveus TaxID=193462 RepID=UPI0036F1157B